MVDDIDPGKEEGIYQAISLARELDLNAADFPEREFEIYRLLREYLPIARTEMPGSGILEGESKLGWFLSRDEDVNYVFRQPELFSSKMGFDFIPQAVDPPEHTEYRKILNPMFSQDEMTPLEPHIQEFASELLDKMLTKDEFDFVKEFAEPFPTIIFCQLMGFPLEDYPKLMRWTNIFIHSSTAGKAEEFGLEAADEEGRPAPEAVRELMVSAGAEVYAYFGGLIEERRKNPGDDIVTELVQARYEGDRPLADDELFKILHLLMLAGLDTVTSSLSYIMLYLAEHPDKRSEFIELMDDPARVGPAVEEMVRFTAIVSPARRVTEDCPYRGLQFHEGDVVILSTPSANRDPRVFENPDEMIFDRHPNPHVGFAVGPHRCLGMHLARRELRIALQEIHRRMPEYTIAPDKKPEIYGGGVKGVTSLHLAVQQASS